MKLIRHLAICMGLSLVVSNAAIAQEPQADPSAATPAPEEKKFYKKIGPDGRVIYTDKPDKDTTEIKVPRGTTYKPVTTPSYVPSRPARKEPEAFKYSVLEFTHPQHDQVNWDNNNTLAVTIKIEPQLQSAHTLVLLLDGQQVAEGSQTSLTLNEVYPGTHQLSVEVRDHQNNTVGSHAVTFHQRRHTIKR